MAGGVLRTSAGNHTTRSRSLRRACRASTNDNALPAIAASMTSAVARSSSALMLNRDSQSGRNSRPHDADRETTCTGCLSNLATPGGELGGDPSLGIVHRPSTSDEVEDPARVGNGRPDPRQQCLHVRRRRGALVHEVRQPPWSAASGPDTALATGPVGPAVERGHRLPTPKPTAVIPFSAAQDRQMSGDDDKFGGQARVKPPTRHSPKD